ncbi:hypothetical protein SDC9_161026 [bioreactor metagenome]|uniref:Uncharacterized protein n=1 Tax=bioreactor metagenome TaxID=1076179 RepID=A0A645FJJ9_9ZZZZ
MKPILDFIPDGGFAQGPFHQLVQLLFLLHAMDPRSEGDVVIDGHVKGIGFLEHHADLLAQHHDVHVAVDVAPFEFQCAFHPGLGNQIIHAIQTAQEGGFPAAGRPNQGGDFIFPDIQIEILQRLKLVVPEIHLAHANDGFSRNFLWAAFPQRHLGFHFPLGFGQNTLVNALCLIKLFL